MNASFRRTVVRRACGITALGVSTLLSTGAALAAGDDAEVEIIGGIFSRLASSHDYVSQKLETSAQKFDTFFGDDRVFDEATGTYLQWRMKLTWNEGWNWDLANKFRFKLRLPRTENRFRVLIETNPKEDMEEGVAPIPDDILQEATDSKNLSAGFEYSRVRFEKWTLSMSPGMRLKRPLDPYVRFRARRSFENETGVARFTNKLAWFTEEGWEFSTRLDLDRPVAGLDLFRSTTELGWNEEDLKWFPEQRFTYQHRIDEKRGISFSVGGKGESKPALRPVQFFSNAGYRQLLYKNWLYGDLVPQVVFGRDNDFNADWSITFQLEVLFGHPYLVGRADPGEPSDVDPPPDRGLE